MTAPTWYTSPSRSRTPWWAKALIGVAVACVVGCGLFVAAVAVALSGGLDDVLDWDKPGRDDRAVRAARAEATPRVEQLQQQLASARLVDTGVRVARDDCSVGQHNWKVDSDYDLSCTVVRSTAYAYAPAAAAVVADLDAALAGWESQPSVSVDPLDRRWTSGGDPQGEAGVLEVTVEVVQPIRAGYIADYDLGAYDGEGITRHGTPFDPTALNHPLLVVTVSERYFYE